MPLTQAHLQAVVEVQQLIGRVLRGASAITTDAQSIKSCVVLRCLVSSLAPSRVFGRRYIAITKRWVFSVASHIPPARHHNLCPRLYSLQIAESVNLFRQNIIRTPHDLSLPADPLHFIVVGLPSSVQSLAVGLAR